MKPEPGLPVATLLGILKEEVATPEALLRAEAGADPAGGAPPLDALGCCLAPAGLQRPPAGASAPAGARCCRAAPCGPLSWCGGAPDRLLRAPADEGARLRGAPALLFSRASGLQPVSAASSVAVAAPAAAAAAVATPS
jgi:hypothetical protein